MLIHIWLKSPLAWLGSGLEGLFEIPPVLFALAAFLCTVQHGGLSSNGDLDDVVVC